MYCKSCGKQIDDDSIFCSFCGTKHNKSFNSVVEETHIRHTEKKQVENKKAIEKYDLTYEKEKGAKIFGIIVLVASAIFLVFFSHSLNDFDAVESANKILGAFGAIFRITAIIWVPNIARRQNRSGIGWGFLAFFFPAIALIIIGSLRKLNTGVTTNISNPISDGNSCTEQKQKVKFNENLNSTEDIIRELEKQKDLNK